ncbi:MAG: DNA repair protein RadA [Burkholderiaceae bacterium]
MAKSKMQYVCSECGHISTKWLGQCSACQAWNTLVETAAPADLNTRSGRFASLAPRADVQQLADIQAENLPRFSSALPEFDRVLGGGLVPGMVVLLGGDPGIGKSTLLLQSLALQSLVGATGQQPRPTVLYVSGEESAGQIALRAQRLGMENAPLSVLTEIELEKIIVTLQNLQPTVVVIDSIQTVYTTELSSAPGSVAQVRECAAQLTRVAKANGIAMLLVGHVTKEGTLAGPRVLEHIVDTVLYFEGDTHSSYRLVRAFKNRFGAVNELGVFGMTDRGLKGVSNPSALFLSQHGQQVPGSCVLVTQEGTRPLLVEVQALVDTSHLPAPRRLTVGLDQNRLAMLLAVLHRHAGLAFFDQDIFVNAVGGVRISEPAADLAIVLAMVSSLKNRALPKGLFAFGEIGLSGEIRPAPRGQERLKEAAKLGFSYALIPTANQPRQAIDGLRIVGVDRIEQALDALRDALRGE